MAALFNSTRFLLQATYTPAAVDSKQSEKSTSGRALEKRALVVRLAPTAAELAAAAKRLGGAKNRQGTSASAAQFAADLAQAGLAGPLHAPEVFREVSPQALVAFAEALIAIRTEAARATEPTEPSGTAAVVLAGDLAAALDRDRGLVVQFVNQMAIQPTGWLHLERMGFSPAGIERGELVHSVPLAPAEEVNVTHIEWAHTSEEFETLVTDSEEGYSEQGVSEKAELSQSTTTQQQHSSAFNVGVTASAGFGGVNVTSSFGHNVADSATQSAQSASKTSREMTRKASSRAKQEHKTSFRVSSASGTQDQAVQRIVNPFTDRAVRVDLYQLIRKWRVDLYRYGIRLTYDLTVPDPGVRRRALLAEIDDLVGQLAGEFPGVVIDRHVRAFPGPDPQKLQSWAGALGVTLDPLPPSPIHTLADLDHQFTGDAIGKGFTGMVELDIDDSYQIRKASSHMGVVYNVNSGDPSELLVTALGEIAVWRHPHGHLAEHTWVRLEGARGKIPFAVDLAGPIYSVTITIDAEVELRPEVLQAWCLTAWQAIVAAARAAFEAQQATLGQRLDDLRSLVGQDDALSLRRIEREEIMRAVLEELGLLPVPDIALAGLGGPNTYAGLVGQVINFLHNAIEWENMLYFLYPYFWAPDSSQEQLRLFLHHPDSTHQAFLKAGAARVVFTVRPGFETQVLSFIDTLSFDPTASPYVTIAQETEDYAQANFPGILPANDPSQTARPQLSRRQQAAWSDMQRVIARLQEFYSERGHYPASLDELDRWTDADGVSFAVPPDPWGRQYVYTYPGVYGEFDLVCYGSDGVPGPQDQTDVDALDITSWAEGNLVATWYDYTPTSALDIAFAEVLPTE